MVSDVGPALTPVAGVVQGSQTPVISKVQDASGVKLPQIQQAIAAQAAAQKQAAAASASNPTDLVSLVTLLNKYLNDSGLPTQFRIAPYSNNKLIQEINPSNGEVIGQFSAQEFPELAISAGISGLLVNDHA